MSIRPTQASIFDLVRSGISLNYGTLLEAQEQLATGKRILRPSDDAIGTTRSLSLRRQSSVVEGYLSAIQSARPVMQTAASEVQEMSGLYTEARGLVLQAMNGTLSQGDRDSLAGSIELLRASMLDVANSTFGEQYLFGGTETSSPPYSEVQVLGESRAVYNGDGHARTASVGRGTTVATAIQA
jgi:flagellar hook-associated protein 3 FlgL